jgi:hypothetical protein
MKNYILEGAFRRVVLHCQRTSNDRAYIQKRLGNIDSHI